MRAWHLLLAVLATLQTIVQVASTEDNTISSRFIQAIQPIKKDIITFVQDNPTTITTAIKPPNTAVIQKPPMTTALMDFHGDHHHHQTIVYKAHKKSDSDKLSDKQQQPQQQHKQKHIKQQQQQVQNIENPYQQNIASENHNNKNNIIDITNLEEIETNDLNEKVIKKFDKTEERAVVAEKYQENLTEDKTSLKYSKQKQQHKTNNNNKNKMALSVNTKQPQQQQQQQQQEQQTNEQQINQKINTEDAAATTQISSSLQQQPHHHNQHQQQQQQTQPASQPHQQQQHQQQHPNHQQQQQHHHHHHHHNQQHQQHHHHHQQHTQQQHQSNQQTSDNLSSPITTPTQSPFNNTTITTTTPMDVDVVAEDVEPQVDAVIPEDGPRTYSNKEIIGDKVKPDPSTLVEIENSLLSLFKMKRPPKIDRSKIIIPEAMKQLYAQIMGHELNSVNIPKPGLLTKSANTVRSFTHQDSKIDDRFPHHHRFRLYFDTKSIPAEEKLKAAELQLTRDAISHASLNPRLATRIRYQVLVYDITRVGVRGKREPSYLLLDNKTIRLNSTETVSLDVQPAVDRWLASPNKNFGLLVEVRTSRSLKPAPHPHVRLRRSADEEHEAWQHKQPLLFTYTDDGSHKSRSIRDVSNRSKRAGGGHHRRSHRRKNSEEICHRHSLYVDFADVGWSDWIVAPPGYDAFYCQGKCPFPLAEHLNSTNHAVVQTIVNNVSPEKVPRACCVPTQLEGISMLYLNDQSTVVLKNYQDMTVVGCGCR